MIDDERIEAVARALCKGLGLDPDELVQTNLSSIRRYSQMYGVPDQDEVEMAHTEAVVPRWRLWRWQAELALVTQLALLVS